LLSIPGEDPGPSEFPRICASPQGRNACGHGLIGLALLQSALSTPAGPCRRILDDDPLLEQSVTQLVSQGPVSGSSSRLSLFHPLLLLGCQNIVRSGVLDKNYRKDLIAMSKKIDRLPCSGPCG
jgi:hypothetical protein